MSSAEVPDEKGVELDTRREAVKLKGFALAVLAFQTLGIIYSDIGTSPLYVLNGIWPSSGSSPSKEDVIGGISAVVWALTLLPLLKYVVISLWFGTHEGEGGSFALYQGLFPPPDKDFDADRTLTGDSGTLASRSDGAGPRIKGYFRWPLLIWCLLGTALTMADGVFTPAVSVTSAVGGIAVAKPSVQKNVVPISIVILVVLFLGQRFGTGKIAYMFSPISLIWLLLLASTGIYNITYAPGIFRAWDPSRAVLLFVRTKNYEILAGVLLAITGCEAMFANLGQFNAISIRISFCSIVYPSLILAYLGQGARLIHNGDAVISNVFYNTIPGPHNGALFWIVFVFAILATIVASQALITATFSLVQQVINMKAFPPVRMVHTSETIQGQVYIPAVNWALMILAIVIIAAFNNLANLTNAYGFAVATVMLSTSVMIAVHIYSVKRLPVILALAYFLTFGFFDALFWGASFKKIPHGAWVPLVIGLVLLAIMSLWTWAKELEDRFDGANRKNLRRFIQQGEGATVTLQISSGNEEIISENEDTTMSKSEHLFYYIPDDSKTAEVERKRLQRIPTCAVFHKVAHGKGVPHSFIAFIRQWPALPRVVIFLSVCVASAPRIPKSERYVVKKVRTVDGFYGVTYYIGFRDDFDVKIYDLIEKICEVEMQTNPENGVFIAKEIRDAAQTSTHIVPHYNVVSRHVSVRWISPIANWIRRTLIEEFYRRLATMFPETGNWLTSADEIIHVGINAAI